MVGVKQEEAFQIMDGLTTSICDSCTPMITSIVSMACIDEKVVIVVTIQESGQRPYYITAVGKEKGTYVRVSGTARHADSFIIRELEFEGANRCFDQTYAALHDAFTASEINQLYEDLRKSRLEGELRSVYRL